MTYDVMYDVGVISGGFDPLHSGHIAMIRSAALKCKYLIVALNSDDWLTRKKGRFFLSFDERRSIVQNIKGVGFAFPFDDSDGTAIEALKMIKEMYPGDSIAFFNGGDRTNENIPEMSVEGIHFEFGVGGANKKNSSSWILNNWTNPVTERPWGYYRVLYTEGHHTKVKELVCMPGKSLSMQRHKYRNELWYVSDGRGQVELQDETIDIQEGGRAIIRRDTWHRLFNAYDKPIKIIEIQYGDRCDEADIERR